MSAMKLLCCCSYLLFYNSQAFGMFDFFSKIGFLRPESMTSMPQHAEVSASLQHFNQSDTLPKGMYSPQEVQIGENLYTKTAQRYMARQDITVDEVHSLILQGTWNSGVLTSNGWTVLGSKVENESYKYIIRNIISGDCDDA